MKNDTPFAALPLISKACVFLGQSPSLLMVRLACLLASGLVLLPVKASGQDTLSDPGPHLLNTRPGQIRLLPDSEYYPALMQAIGTAKDEIYLAMFLCKITDSPKNQARLILEELSKARQREVKITILLEESGYNKELTRENRRTATFLKKHGITVFFDTPQVTTHAKMVIIDRRYLFVGSHNLTHSALSRNHEVSILVDNPKLAQEGIFYLQSLSTH